MLVPQYPRPAFYDFAEERFSLPDPPSKLIETGQIIDRPEGFFVVAAE